MHRAITNESIWRVAYALIIAMEGLTALLLALGAVMLLGRFRGACRGLQPLQGLGSSRIDCRLCPLVFWLHGHRWRIFRNVAVEGVERPGGRVPHHHSDPCSADFCQPAGRRRWLTNLHCTRSLYFAVVSASGR